jgi:hypothetical protein
MKLHFLLAGAVAIGLLISAPVSMAHGGGGGGSGQGGSSFHGGFHSGGFHSGGFHGRGGRHFFRGRFFGPGFAFYGYPYPWWGWWGWDYPYYPYYGYDAYYGGSDSASYAGNQQSQFSSPRAVQAALAWRGYYSGRIDGVMGPETVRAIRSFQAHQGLPVTGQIDSGLMDALRER